MAKILVTDDAAFARRMVKKALKEDNHEVIEAANGQECLDAIANDPPDCIFLDLLMPELDGFGVLRELRDRGSEIPVIVLSADIQDSAREECMNLGATLMLKKPPKAPKIRETVNQVLGI